MSWSTSISRPLSGSRPASTSGGRRWPAASVAGAASSWRTYAATHVKPTAASHRRALSTNGAPWRGHARPLSPLRHWLMPRLQPQRFGPPLARLLAPGSSTPARRPWQMTEGGLRGWAAGRLPCQNFECERPLSPPSNGQNDAAARTAPLRPTLLRPPPYPPAPDTRVPAGCHRRQAYPHSLTAAPTPTLAGHTAPPPPNRSTGNECGPAPHTLRTPPATADRRLVQNALEGFHGLMRLFSVS